ncbi:hypothetical protein C834K_0209 [Chlamydia poikilotherma]|uniref:Uncharacterized protein n=1 Tax=Chlamydia poikilotherma TaxID=1967783 RepID=A0A3B0Q6J8_9CHLA|nr:hypothetical protein [Chlamydia poikilotherma]SYX08687.1 hypothetical protein C834K_0209 [Chlamydia poikilotherma]
MQIRFQTTEDFDNAVGNFPRKCQMLFPRDDEGLWDISSDWDLMKSNALKNSALAALPLIGSIMGLIKLFSVWSVNLRGESKRKILAYTITGLMEFCGLGIVTLVLKILCLFFKIIFTACKSISSRIRREQILPEYPQDGSSTRTGLLFS